MKALHGPVVSATAELDWGDVIRDAPSLALVGRIFHWISGVVLKGPSQNRVAVKHSAAGGDGEPVAAAGTSPQKKRRTQPPDATVAPMVVSVRTLAIRCHQFILRANFYTEVISLIHCTGRRS